MNKTKSEACLPSSSRDFPRFEFGDQPTRYSPQLRELGFQPQLRIHWLSRRRTRSSEKNTSVLKTETSGAAHVAKIDWIQNTEWRKKRKPPDKIKTPEPRANAPPGSGGDSARGGACV
ncbi:hypothetical protein Droror1_Dr00024633 [Drosera rotundifolia]